MTSIIDNREGNTLHKALDSIVVNGEELWIATAFFSLDALNLVGAKLQDFAKVRLLFGDDASKSQRKALLDRMKVASDRDLLAQRLDDPFLGGLAYAKQLIDEGRLEARCYTRAKFHAKAYISHLPNPVGPHQAFGILGSGNFTRPGLEANIELNAHLTPDQTQQLIGWYRDRWEEAEQDEVTLDLKREVERHLKLHDPHTIYLKALLAWGDHVQGRKPLKPLEVLPLLDPHQVHAYQQALKILEREPGVMVCDGVGLGKSFVALALMEHWLSEGSRVLLVAPKAILKSSWEGYLRRYLNKYSRGFSNIHTKPMTWFGFDGKGDEEELELLKEYAEQADVVIIDESHNFRNSASKRYENLYKVVAPNARGRKKIVLLTATPVNTRYEDLAVQMQILTHDDGVIAGIPRVQLTTHARNRDTALRKSKPQEDQDTLFDYSSIVADKLLGTALEAVAIQRSRKTCRELAEAAGKNLRFPKRTDPIEVHYVLGGGHQALIREAKLRFEELGEYLARYTAAVSQAAGQNLKLDFGDAPQNGLKFSGYLPNRFLKGQPEVSNRNAQVEAFLAKMVFVNVMKQLESSTPAFQSIIEALGHGLALRLRHYCGDEHAVQDALARHQDWIKLPTNPEPDDKDLGEEPEDATADEASGGETDDFVCREERRAIKRLKSLGFSRASHELDRWRDDIINDLEHLETIHQKCLSARRETDGKLLEIEKCIRAERAQGRKVLVFTQSRRTADYIRPELERRLGEHVGLVNADIGGDTRARILHAFSPNYNDLPARGRTGEMRPLPAMHVLISTDVLSEGVNLQEAGCIINYDLHWNPTRLIQRIGRVDRRLREEDPDHSFDIYNVFPPKAIEDVIELVGTVESRKRKIGRLLGLDVSFFRATDPAGTLREFNALYEGGTTPREAQMIEYVKQVNLADDDQAAADALPPGALGVWQNAPINGVFALFQVVWRKHDQDGREIDPALDIPEVDRLRFGKLIGGPRLLLQNLDDRKLITDAPAILDVLSNTTKGEPSGTPSDRDVLSAKLRALRESALDTIRDRTQSVTVDLVCWMELRTS